MTVLVNLSVVHAGACMDFYGPDEIFIDDQMAKNPPPLPSLSLSLLLLYLFIYLFIYNKFLLPYFLRSIFACIFPASLSLRKIYTFFSFSFFPCAVCLLLEVGSGHKTDYLHMYLFILLVLLLRSGRVFF
jgi:hypothetical protein